MLKQRITRWLSRTVPPKGINTANEIEVALFSDIGLSRTENQDCVAGMRVNASATTKAFTTIVLSDGMGGMHSGKECATHAVSTFLSEMVANRHEPAYARLEIAVKQANNCVYQMFEGKGGATLSAIVVEDGELPLIANIGDSRIYATATDNKLYRLTKDDTLAEVFGGSGRDLIQYIGMGEGILLHISAVHPDASKIIMTSDGVHFLSHETISSIIKFEQDPGEILKKINLLVRWCGAPDNASMAIIDIKNIKSTLFTTSEPGINIIDPHGSMYIIWTKQNNTSDDTHTDRPNAEKKLDTEEVQGKKRIRRSKSKRQKSPTPQIEIEIDNIKEDES